MSLDISGPWSKHEADQFLSQARFPMRLSCIGSDGYPRVVSLWFRYESDTLLCVTHRNSQLAAILRQNDKVGFEISPNEPPYFGLRGQGQVSLEPLGNRSTLEELLHLYLGNAKSSLADWLLSRSEEELLVSVKPHRYYSWDYRERMAAAAAQTTTSN